MKLLSYLSFILSVSAFVLAVVSVNLSDKAINRISAMAAFCYSVWSMGMAFAYGSNDPQVSVIMYRVSFFGSLFIVPFLVWSYLLLTEASAKVQLTFLVPAFAYSCAVLADFWLGGFYYVAFREGPWGNIGVPDASRDQFLANLTPYVSMGELLFGIGWIIAVRRKTDSRRLRHQIDLLVLAMAATCALYFLAWLLESVYGFPNAMVLAGVVLVAFNLYLILRYRYLRSSVPELEKHVSRIMQEAAVLLDRRRAVVGANPVAETYFGHPEEELLGLDFAALLDDPDAFVQEWGRARARRTVHDRVPVLVDGRGFMLTVSPRFDGFGDFVGAMIFVGGMDRFEANSGSLGITPREKEILVLMAEGCSNQDMADRLGLSPGTVKRHSHNLLEKTGTANRVELLERLFGK